MAKINGVEIKSKRLIQGKVGVGFGAVIYMDNERIGTVKDEGDGNGMFYNFTRARNEILFSYRKDDYVNLTKSPNMGMREFINRLMELNDIEKAYKNESKKLRGAAFDLVETQKIEPERETLKSSGIFIFRKGNQKRIVDRLNSEGIEYTRINVFASLKDFDFTTDEKKYNAISA